MEITTEIVSKASWLTISCLGFEDSELDHERFLRRSYFDQAHFVKKAAMAVVTVSSSPVSISFDI